jgi:hypothetical protein
MWTPRLVFAGVIVVVALGGRSGGADEKGATSPARGLYTSAVYEDEAAMLKDAKGPKHHCMWKGREKKEAKVICRNGVQLRCGARGWYKTGPC